MLEWLQIIGIHLKECFAEPKFSLGIAYGFVIGLVALYIAWPLINRVYMRILSMIDAAYEWLTCLFSTRRRRERRERKAWERARRQTHQS